MTTPPLNEYPESSDREPYCEPSLEVGASEDAIHLTLAEETLTAHVVEREQGKVLIHRRVEVEPVEARVDLHHDDVVVDKVEVNDFAAERREPWYEGETLMVPVYEEVLVSETKLMLRSVIRVTNKGRHEQVNLRGMVRRDVVDIEEIDS